MGAVIAVLVLSTASSAVRADQESCETLCGQNDACPGAQQQDCDSFCGDTASIDAASVCDAAYSDYLGCKGEHEAEVCDPDGGSCIIALAAYFDCISAFCSQAPIPAACQ